MQHIPTMEATYMGIPPGVGGGLVQHIPTMEATYMGIPPGVGGGLLPILISLFDYIV